MTPDNIRASAQLTALPGQELTMAKALDTLAQATRLEAGCIQYEPLQCADNPLAFMIYEVWSSQAHLEAHWKRPPLAAFTALASTIVATPPDVRLWKALP